MGNKKIIILIIVFFVLGALIGIFFYFSKYHFRKFFLPSNCGIENCHGLNIQCGKNIPEACTEEYQIGDKCRKYAKCGIINGTCQLIENKKFKKCKSCVEKCIKDFRNNAEKQFRCEEECS